MIKTLNVVDLEKWKEMKEIRKSEERYAKYLGTLANSQLESEVNYLLDEYSGDASGNDFFSRGKLILKEISSRTHGSVRAQIDRLNFDTLRLI